jgi:hypothetical protein
LPDAEDDHVESDHTEGAGRCFVCIAAQTSAEPNSLVVMMEFAERDRWRKVTLVLVI